MKAPARTIGNWRAFAPQLSRDKSDTLLLLLGVVMVLAPHASHLPLWASLICAVTLLWRALITLRGTRMPPIVLLLSVAALSMSGILRTYHTLLGRDAGVAMLVMLLTFKTLEMRGKRDLFVVTFLCFFLVLTNFFYSQDIGTALMMIASTVTIVCAQLTFQYTGVVPSLGRRLRLAGSIVALAAPLAVLLFFGFPRIQGPLWGMPGDARSGRSGLSDTMSPGNLSGLAMSDEPAFRVKFAAPVPAQEKLYWRALVLGKFDGRTWSRVGAAAGRASGQASPVELLGHGDALRYQVTQEPSTMRALFVLEMGQQPPRIDGTPAQLSSELEITAPHALDERVRFDTSSFLEYRLQPSALPDSERWLELPRGTNPRATQYGVTLRYEANPVKRINAVLTMFAREGFSYTLEPPLLGPDSIDEFLYTTRAGFCEHYAGAFVFLMRAAAIPARVVVGYQGGERNPVDGILTVSQSDAHAWAEVWLAGRGWVRVDPTAAIAPERVHKNLASAIPRKEPFGLPALGKLIQFASNGNSWLGRLRYQLSALNNGWNQWVLNYTPERQRDFLAALGAYLTWYNGLALALIGALLWCVRALALRRRINPIDALYSQLCAQLARRGMPRAVDEGPDSYAERAARLVLEPQQKAALLRFLALYSDYKYGVPPHDAKLHTTLQHLLRKVR